MRFSAVERDILGRASLLADKSLPELAKLSRRKIHTVRYAITRMKDRNIITKAWVIDVFRLGWQRFQLLLAIGGGNRQQFINYLRKTPHVAHVAEIGGKYDFDVAIVASSAEEALSVLQQAAIICGAVLRDKVITAQSTIHYFPRKYMCSGKALLGEIVVGDNKERYELTSIEKAVLTTLIELPDISRKDLSKRLELSPPTVDARMRRLQDAGVIRGAMYGSRYVELGMQNFKILISMAGITPEVAKKMHKIAYQHPHCTSFRAGLGAWDFELQAEVERYQQLTELKELLWHEVGSHVHSIEIIPRFKLHFYNSYPVM
jgi:DNA-binding Lrp family transcriptional regulator